MSSRESESKLGEEQRLQSARDELITAMGMADEGASTDRMLELFYAEIHRLAGHYLGAERDAHTLQPTALVNEAYLRLLGDTQVVWENRRHFIASAARAMRRYLVDHARGKLRDKRGGAWKRVEVTLSVQGEDSMQMNLVDLDRALEELNRLFEREARVVELRYFAGLSMEQVAEILGVNQRTVERDWRHARAWLLEKLS